MRRGRTGYQHAEHMIDHRPRGVFVSICPQLVLSLLLSSIRFQDRDALESGCEGYDVEGDRLREPGEEGADDPGVVLAVADAAVALVLTEDAAAAGLQRAQMKMLKPRPWQLVQMEPLRNEY